MIKTRLRRTRDERGMTTAEYAVGTVASCGFAGLLYQLLNSEFGQRVLKDLWELAVSVVL
ncbi:MAG TPA: DUF4244 domain-containing protein [Nocardioidaceae bacterium]|jgi:hypothetical protein|nr:DUF4244 domain-containing protein [Actinomycetota bacterium]HEV8056757.1 DUF4244 domain-containing protein [Nocardioidaceae bacterium]